MVVMVMIGVVAGIGMAGFDRIEPGRSSFQASIENFIESSRDRARASNQSVIISVKESTDQLPARWQRMVFRQVFEASFESMASSREGIAIQGQAQLQVAGRFGACLDLSEGGVGVVAGRGNPHLSDGFVIDLDCYPTDVKSGKILQWPGVVTIEQGINGVLSAKIRAGDGEFFSNTVLESPAATLRANRWQHLRLVAADGQSELYVNGKSVAKVNLPRYLSSAQDAPAFGDADYPWHGKIDEFSVQSRQIELGPQVPDDLQIGLSTKEITFNRFGVLAKQHSDPVMVSVKSFSESLAEFVVGRFSQEVFE